MYTFTHCKYLSLAYFTPDLSGSPKSYINEQGREWETQKVITELRGGIVTLVDWLMSATKDRNITLDEFLLETKTEGFSPNLVKSLISGTWLEISDSSVDTFKRLVINNERKKDPSGKFSQLNPSDIIISCLLPTEKNNKVSMDNEWSTGIISPQVPALCIIDKKTNEILINLLTEMPNEEEWKQLISL